MTDTRRKVAAMTPLVERMNRSHCWLKTTDGPRRLAEPFTEFMLAEHCAGRKAYGLCPIVPGESSCRVACLDLDSHKGETPFEEMQDIAQSIAFLLEQEGHAPHLYRSSGGHGIHIYLMWAEVQDAYSVREMLRGVLAALGYTNGAGGVAAKQIEIFPKQDEVPNDGFGSMFVLPGSGKSEPLGQSEWLTSAPVPVVPRPAKPERVVTHTPELDRLKSALDAIPNDAEPLEYDAWRNVVFALHYATEGSDEGLALAHEFSQRSPKYDPEFLDSRVWPYVGVNSATPVTERSLFALAGQHGWQDPTVADDFEVVEESPDDFDVLPVDTLVPSEVPTNKQRFRVIGEDEFLDAPPVSWLVKGVLPHAELGTMYGESGSGKSFMAFDLAAAVSLGVEWRGRKVRQGRVVYVAAEGAGGFRNRVKAYRLHNELERTGVDVIANAPNLIEKADAVDICKSILAKGKADLVIIDTLAQSMQGNENSGEDMGKVLAHCKGIHRATGAMVLLIHHSGKDSNKGARGWSGLRAACDVELEVMRADDDRVLTVTKQKDGEDGAEFGFRLEVVAIAMDDDGDVISSCVVEHRDSGTTRARTRLKGTNQKLVMSVFDGLEGLDGEGVEREVLLTGMVAAMDPPEEGKKDRRREMAVKAIESVRDLALLAVDGARLKRVEP